jgi:hypothetical protein
MEGNFIVFLKKHVIHTNMAKAALNMLTHTAGELAKSDLYECCGTGWVTDEDPAELAK